jgi:cyclopropane fatty-acyl-phospholipid synthase-like methyltransferase
MNGVWMPVELPFSRACENNKAPILEKLREIFTSPGRVLEIGTGTGQHAVHFATAMPHLQWQPTDHPDAADTGRARLERAALANTLPVIGLDVSAADWPVQPFTWAFSANTAHIMAWSEVEQMFVRIGERLPPGGAFCLYGPFNDQGRFSSESNRRFDQHLRARDSSMGIRDLEELCALAETAGLTLTENFTMPANNRLLVFRSTPITGRGSAH